MRYDPHPSHAGFDQINEYIKYLKPKRTLFTHMTALLDYDELMSKCSENVEPAYDGMTIRVMKDKKIGFIGLGNVGSKIAYNILKNKNYSLFIFDLNKKTSKKLVSEGAILCNSIEELINNVTVFITCLPSPNSVKNTLLKTIPLFK